LHRKRHKFKLFGKFKRLFKKAKQRVIIIEYEDPVLTKLKNDLIDDCIMPEVLLCPILQDVPTELVVTPYGQIFNRKELITWINKNHDCPMTRRVLDENDLIQVDRLSLLAKNIHWYLDEIVDAINVMSLDDEGNVRSKILAYNSYVELADQDAANILSVIIQQALIQDLKDRLMLDINNSQHLSYWQNHCSATFDVCDQIYSEPDERHYRIPRMIHELMLAANEPYKSKQEFKTAIDALRRDGQVIPKFSLRPFAFFVTSIFRQPAGSVIRHADDIETVQLMPNLGV